MNKKKTISPTNTIQKTAYQRGLTKEFLEKYDKLSNDELQDEIDKLQNQISLLKLTNESLEQEDKEMILSRDRNAEAFTMLSKYNSILQTETQNLHIKLNFDAKLEEDNIKYSRSKISDLIEETTVNAIEISKNTGGVELLQNRQQKLIESLENQQKAKQLKKLKTEYQQLFTEYEEKRNKLTVNSNLIQNQKKDLENLKQENQKLEN